MNREDTCGRIARLRRRVNMDQCAARLYSARNFASMPGLDGTYSADLERLVLGAAWPHAYDDNGRIDFKIIVKLTGPLL